MSQGPRAGRGSGRPSGKKKRASSGPSVGAIAGGAALLVVAGIVWWSSQPAAPPPVAVPPTAVEAPLPPTAAASGATTPAAGDASRRPASEPRNPRAGWGFDQHLIDLYAVTTSGSSETGIVDWLAYLKQPLIATPPDDWTIAVDPPPVPPARPESRKKVRWIIPESASFVSDGSVVFPASPSSCVALGRNEAPQAGRLVVNLATNQELGRVVGQHSSGGFSSHCALSPDGSLLAFAEWAGGGATTIKTFDVATGAYKGNLTVPDTGNVAWLAAPSAQHLVFGSGFDKAIHVVDVTSSKLLYSRPRDHFSSDVAIAFSPGGKYVVEGGWMGDEELTLEWWEVATGKTVQTIVLPFDSNRTTGLAKFSGLRFSADGTEFGALIDLFPLGLIMIWDVATGVPTEQYALESLPVTLATGYFGGVDGLPLDFFPGKSRLLLYETAVLDRSNGALQGRIPASLREVPGSRRALSESSVTVVDYGNNDTGLLIFDLPTKFDPLDQGGRKVTLPPITEDRGRTFVKLGEAQTPDTSALRTIRPQSGNWKTPVEPWPVAASLPNAMRLTGAGRELRSLACQVGSGKAVALRTKAHSPLSVPSGNGDLAELLKHRQRLQSERSWRWRSSGPGVAGWLSLFDLSAEQLTGELALGFPAELLDLSPDGSTVALLSWDQTDGSVRERIVGLELATGRVLGEILVKDGAADSPVLVSATFAGNETLLTLDSQGRLTSWSWPELKPLYAIDNVALSTISGQGSCVGFTDGVDWWFLDTKSGETLGRLPQVRKVSATAWHPQGDRFAMLREAESGPRLSIYDLTTGKLTHDLVVPTSDGPLAWCHDTMLLIANLSLFDIEKKSVVWSIPPDFWAHHLPQHAGGRHWWVDAKGFQAVLRSLELPGPKLSDVIAQSAGESPFAMQPGDTVGLTLGINLKTPHPGFEDRVKKQFQSLLEARGFKVASPAPTIPATFLIQIFESESTSTTTSTRTDPATGTQKSESRTAKRATTKVIATARSNNRQIWTRSRTYIEPLPPDWPTRMPAPAGNIAQQYTQEVADPWAALEAELAAAPRWLPSLILTPEAATGAGKTTWSDLVK